MQETLAVFNNTLSKTHLWLKAIAEDIGSADMEKAYKALRAFLHVLRDQLGIEEAIHLGAQLPMLIRGIYYESWHPSQTAKPVKDMDEFILCVEELLLANKNANIDATAATEAVWKVIQSKITEGEKNHVLAILPKHLKEQFRHCTA